MNKLQLHVSGMNLLSRCGIAFERRYILGEKSPASVAMVTGTAVDRSVTEDLQSRIDTGELLPEEQVKDIARDALVSEWEQGVVADGEDIEEGLVVSRGDATDRAVKLASLHYRTAAQTIRPTHVQRGWTLDIDGVPLQIAGTIDVQEGLDALRDTKTSAKTPMKNVADTSLQLTMYALAIRQHDGAIPKKVVLDYLIKTPKRGDEKLIQIESTRVDADFNPLLERVYQASRQIESGLFTPADPTAWWCTRKFCSFFGDCKYAVRPVSIAA